MIHRKLQFAGSSASLIFQKRFPDAVRCKLVIGVLVDVYEELKLGGGGGGEFRVVVYEELK